MAADANANENEDQLLRSVALQNANAIHLARQRAEEELIQAKESLERKTEELARSLAMMRATLESTTDGILVTDGDGKVTCYNEKYVAIWRVPRAIIDAPEPGPLLEFKAHQAKDPQEFLAVVDRIFTASPPETHDLLELADGRVLERTSRIQYVDARNVGRVWSVRDITARKRSEALLNGQKRVLELMAQGAGLPEVLDALCRTVEGQSKEGVLGSIVLVDRDGLHLRHGGAPSLPDVYNQAVDGLAIGPAMGSCGTAAFRREPVYVVDIATDPLWAGLAEQALRHGLRACWSHPILSGTGDLLGTFAMYYDRPRSPALEDLGLVGIITRTAAIAIERKRAEDDLKTQAVRLRLLWEAAAVLLTTEEPDAMLRELFAKIAPQLGLDTYFNYMVTDLGDALRLESCAGIPEERISAIARLEFGQGLCGSIAQLRQPVVATEIPRSNDPKAEFLRSCGIRAYAGNPLEADGRLLGTLSFASRTRDRFDEDELEFLRTLTHYVTVAYERLRLVSELQDADRKKDDFIAMLGHELRNPLAPVRNGLQIMRLAEGDPHAIEQARGMMDRQLGHMVRLIDDLLDVSRISRNKMELRRDRVALAEVVDNALETARPAIEEAGHTLEVALPSEPLFLDADLTRLAQVLSNLLTNSAKYTERGGRIELKAARRGNEVAITVRDSGIGIARTDLARIFDMFSQVDRSVERATGGLGIGLALVKGVVEMHGGTVTAESGGPGLGSSFTVRLPMLPEAVPKPEPGRGEQPNGDARPPARHLPRRILVVDDHQDSARTMARLLKLRGHEVQTAYDGHEAVAAAEGFHPEVVLMDVGMPGLNGYEATRHIRQQPWGQNTVIIALTGWGQDIDRLQSKAAGCDGHLVKPVDLPDLENLMEELVGHGVAR